MSANPRRPITVRASAPEPSKKKLWIILGAGGGATLLCIGLVILFRKPAVRDEEEPSTTPATEKISSGGSRPSASTPPSDERASQSLFESAEAFAKLHPGEPDHISARYRDIIIKYPGTSWARRAEENYREAESALKRLFESQFESVRLETAALVKKGRYREARGVLERFRAQTANEVLKRRAEDEMVVVENDARDEFNRVIRRAEELSKKGDYDGAEAAMKSARGRSIEETEPLCDQALAELATAKKTYTQARMRKSAEDAEEKFIEQVRETLLPLLKQRKYDEALKFFEGVLAKPESVPIKERVEGDRAIVRAAGDFWEAALKSLRARANQEIALSLVEGPPATGRLARLTPDAVVLRHDEGDVSLALDRIHADQWVALAIGKALPDTDAESYAKAAMFFFCDGREDLARLELATAKEMKGSFDALERSFRAGPLRAALAKK